MKDYIKLVTRMTNEEDYYDLPDYTQMAINQVQDDIAKEINQIIYQDVYNAKKNRNQDQKNDMKRYF